VVNRFIYILGLSIIFISGCSIGDFIKTEADDILFTQLSELQHQIEAEKWEGSLSNINEFEQEYAKQKWKIQLLAAKQDYQDVELEVELLKEYVKDQDKVESMSRLRQILYRLTVIYNM
jgi:hypothetical protein